jgi:hypothetical protein
MLYYQNRPLNNVFTPHLGHLTAPKGGVWLQGPRGVLRGFTLFPPHPKGLQHCKWMQMMDISVLHMNMQEY